MERIETVRIPISTSLEKGHKTITVIKCTKCNKIKKQGVYKTEKEPVPFALVNEYLKGSFCQCSE